jgi:hypothetical protein
MFKKVFKIFSIFIFFIFIVVFSNAFIDVQDKLKLELMEGYPKWLKDEFRHSDQTSGVTFIGKFDNKKLFIIVDDIGAIYYLYIDKNENYSLKKIEIKGEAIKKLQLFAKMDFEDVVYDKYDKKLYVSIEGNHNDYLDEVGVYEFIFSDDNILSGEIIDIKKIEIKPKGKILEFVQNNIGFEGVTVDKKYFYLGLEGFQVGKLFADSTYIYIVDKKTKEIIKRVSTKKYKIGTICGLVSLKDKELLGVDRNAGKIFKIQFDDKFNIVFYDENNIPIQIPKFSNYLYVAAIESITVDDDNFVYCIDDPWKSFYIPPNFILKNLDDETKNNFKQYIPIIYKFNMK